MSHTTTPASLRSSLRSCRAGFTLMELLVVISILVILASILLPALAQGKATSNQTLCMSNLRNQHQAGVAWAFDHDKIQPIMRDAGAGTNFMDQMNEYGTKDETFLCPSADPNPNVSNSANGKTLHYGYNAYGYGATGSPAPSGNTHFDSMDPTVAGGAPRMTAVKNQAAIWIADAEEDDQPESIGTGSRGTDNWPIDVSFNVHAYIRHLGEYNAVSLDGGVRPYNGDVPNNEQWYLVRAWPLP